MQSRTADARAPPERRSRPLQDGDENRRLEGLLDHDHEREAEDGPIVPGEPGGDPERAERVQADPESPDDREGRPLARADRRRMLIATADGGWTLVAHAERRSRLVTDAGSLRSVAAHARVLSRSCR
jgi:hypothetical protein